MANIIKFGSLCLDGFPVNVGTEFNRHPFCGRRHIILPQKAVQLSDLFYEEMRPGNFCFPESLAVTGPFWTLCMAFRTARGVRW